MRKFIFAAVLVSATAMAQQPATMPGPFNPSGRQASADSTEHLVPVSRSDVYCSGFISKTPVSAASYVLGGQQSPHTARFMERDFIFLKGSYQPGTMLSIVREWRNPSPAEIYKGTNKLVAEAGQPYSDVGYVRVVEARGTDSAVAQIEFSCEPVLPGDLVVPFAARPEVSVRKLSTLDRFPANFSSLQGKVLMARDGDQMIVTGRKVFLNIGSEKGVRVGDYFRVSRGYHPDETDKADQATLEAREIDDTQKKPLRLPTSKLREFPKRVLGELVVLCVTPTTATAMVTFMYEEMHAGDLVDREEPAAAAAASGGN